MKDLYGILAGKGLILMNISKTVKVPKNQLSCDKEDISCAFRVDFIGFTFINHRHSFFCEHYTYSSLLYLHLTIISSQQIVEFHPNIINKQNFLEGGRHYISDRALIGPYGHVVRNSGILLVDRRSRIKARSTRKRPWLWPDLSLLSLVVELWIIDHWTGHILTFLTMPNMPLCARLMAAFPGRKNAKKCTSKANTR